VRLAHRPLIAAFAVLAVPLALVSLRVAASEEPPRFDAQPFPEEKSPLPEKAEWAAAADVALDPARPLGQCAARRVREWVRLSCSGEMFGAVRMLGGKRDGLQMRLSGSSDDFNGFPDKMELTIPVRRGDARVLEVMSIDVGYHGTTSVSPWMVISEQWPAEDDAPTLSID
jgi:hypothetical protein